MIEEIKAQIEKYAKCEEPLLPKEITLDVIKMYKLIIRHVNMAEMSIEIPNLNEDAAKISDTLTLVANTVMDIPMDEETRLFIKAFTTLVFNWNQNLFHDPKISVVCKMTNNLSEMQGIMLKAAIIMQHAAVRFRTLSDQCPPAVDITKDQLKIMFDGTLKE